MNKKEEPTTATVKSESDFKKVLARLLRKPHIRHEDLKVSGDHESKKSKAAK